jgi:phage terminase large subunit-like protein
MNNAILAYYQAIKSGAVVVGRWIELLYDRIIAMLERKEVVFDQVKANHAIEYIETHCFHTEGELAPNPLKLELWQKSFVSLIFGIMDENGRRQFREVVLLVGRKNGKSALASAIGKYIFEQDGGFGCRVYCLAPKLDQAEIIYNGLWTMFLVDSSWENLDKDDPTKARHRMTDLYLPVTNSTVKKIAFSAKKSDGFNPSLTICDEVASWAGANGLKQYEVMKSGMGARPEGLLLSCTTSGYENDSIFDELMKRSTRYLLGDSKEKRLLPVLYMIDDVEKWNDINELRKANPNLGVSVSVDYMLEEIAVAEGSLSKKVEFLVKYANVKQNSSAAWLSTQAVEKMCGDPLKLDDFAETYAVCGLDLSQTRDLTACTFVIEKGGEFYVFAKFFLPAERIDECTERDGVPYNIYIQRGLLQPSGENFVDYHDCYEYIVRMIEEYHIYPLMIGYDRYSAQYLIQSLEQYGARTDDVFQGENLWGVLQEMEGLISDGKVHIGDNDLLKIHLLNAAIKMSNERGRGKLVKISPSLHIDGTAALTDAFCVRQKWHQEIGDQLKNED